MKSHTPLKRPQKAPQRAPEALSAPMTAPRTPKAPYGLYGPPSLKFSRNGVPTPVLDVLEAGAYLGVSRGTIYRLVKTGELATVYIGDTLRFRVEELDRYLDAHTTRARRRGGRPRR